MQKLINSFKKNQVPKEFTREDWCAATRLMFSPYIHRQRQLDKNIDLFHIELRNLARIALFPDYTDLLSWCLRLHRRALRRNRQLAYIEYIKLFDNMQISDSRWLNIFQTTTPLETGAAAQDQAYQLFSTIDDVAEGCFKPQLQILFSIAQMDLENICPVNITSMDFGALVNAFPQSLRNQVPWLLADPDLLIPINQWRNIAAHKNFNLVGPRTIEVTYGKSTIRSERLGIHRLRKVWQWLLKVHTAVRLANTIIYIEHMQELYALGLPKVNIRFSARLSYIVHQLSTVGFESTGWVKIKRDGVLSVRDRLQRQPKEALIHASQMLDQLSVGILLDATTKNRMDRVGISLVMPDGTCFGTALISVKVADAYSLRKIDLNEYMDNIEWRLGK
ncbi:MAG: hypothetical protein ACO1N8_09995 [Methylophilus sp.]